MFTVKWVTRGNEGQPISVEKTALRELDLVVSFYMGKFMAMRLDHPRSPPDGFLIFDDEGQEVLRRWFELPRQSTRVARD